MEKVIKYMVLAAAGCGTVDYERFKQIRDE